MTKILATLDGSEISRDILPAVTHLARDLGARVTLLEIVQPAEGTVERRSEAPPVIGTAAAGSNPSAQTELVRGRGEPRWAENRGQAIERVLEEAREALTDIARSLEAEGIDVDEKVVMAERPAEAIVEFARSEGFDYIAMATHGRSGLNELVQGSVAGGVVKSGVAPVILVRPNG